MQKKIYLEIKFSVFMSSSVIILKALEFMKFYSLRTLFYHFKNNTE